MPPVMRPVRLLALATLLLVPAAARAQGAPAGAPAGTPPGGPARQAPGEIRGRLVIGTGAAARGHASGSITVLRGPQGTFAGGALPRPDGSFVVDGLMPGRYTVRIRAIGYAPVLREDVVVAPASPRVDLGDVALAEVATQLAQQTVTAERAEQQLSPERNSYDVKRMAAASGGTAVDALRNVPSVEVDGSNVVSLRGNSNVVVQINGRTSPLRGEQLGNFLAQLPAQSLQNIEVVTSPSAKDDPEGTAGIINIVLAQPVAATTSGGFTAATGTTGLGNVSGNVGKQDDKWTLFGSLGTFRDGRVMEGDVERRVTGGSTTSYSNSRLDGTMRPFSGNAMFRSEYKRSKTDAVSFDAMGNLGDFRRPADTRFAQLDPSRDTVRVFDQLADNGQHNYSMDYTLGYRRTGPPTATTFNGLLRFTQFGMHFQSLRSNTLVTPLAQDDPGLPPTERNGLRVRFPAWILQGDLVRPIDKSTKLEAGLKSTLRTLNSGATAAVFDTVDDAFEPLAGRNYSLRYAEAIQAAYGTLSRRAGKAQLQGGLRVEQTNTDLERTTVAGDTKRDYLSVFPSAFFTYNLTEMRQVRVGYSRRITRPDAPQLDPSPFYEDARTLFRGNPNLRAEYTDAVELTLQDGRGWGSVQLNPYIRVSDDAVRNIRTIDDAGITTSTFANVASTRTIGSDLNGSVRKGPLNLSLGGGAFHYRSEAGALSTRTFGWNARTNATWKLTKQVDLMMNANYRARQAVEGGTMLPFLMTQFMVRQKLWGENGSVTLRISDPFDAAKFAMRTNGNGVTEETERRFGMRGVFLSFQRNFGQQLRLRPPQNTDPAPQGGGLPGGPPGN